MDEVRQTAMFCVGRAVLFGCLAISCVMLSFAFDGMLLFRSGEILAMLMAAILLWYAQTAQHRSPKKSETWILLPEEHRPQNEHALRAFQEIQREVYAYYGYCAALVGLGFLAVSIVMWAFGIRIGIGLNAEFGSGSYPSFLTPALGTEP